MEFLDRWVQARWARRAEAARTQPLGHLRRDVAQARALGTQIDRVLQRADARASQRRDDVFARPLGCDWVWRPEPWSAPLGHAGLVAPLAGTRICPGITLHHTAQTADLIMRQVAAPPGLRLDVFDFDGPFASLSISLPPEGLADLRRNHVIMAGLDLRVERPAPVFCRLNVRHGPNTEQILRAVPPGGGPQTVAFDLAYTQMNEKRLESAWLDVIFEAPRMNAFVLRDLLLLRHPRADI